MQIGFTYKHDYIFSHFWLSDFLTIPKSRATNSTQTDVTKIQVMPIYLFRKSIQYYNPVSSISVWTSNIIG